MQLDVKLLSMFEVTKYKLGDLNSDTGRMTFSNFAFRHDKSLGVSRGIKSRFRTTHHLSGGYIRINMIVCVCVYSNCICDYIYI